MKHKPYRNVAEYLAAIESNRREYVRARLVGTTVYALVLGLFVSAFAIAASAWRAADAAACLRATERTIDYVRGHTDTWSFADSERIGRFLWERASERINRDYASGASVLLPTLDDNHHP